MQHTEKQINIKWAELLSSGQLLEGNYIVKGLDYLKGVPIFLGLDSINQRHLYIPYFSESRIKPDKRSRGIHILPKPLMLDDRLVLFIDIACKDASYNDIFTLIIKEILEKINADEEKPINICYMVLNRWRRFFGKEYKKLLKINELIGIYGELWHLREVIKINNSAIDLWIGPEHAVHDIKRGNTAVEVKTTLKREGRFFEIHGIDQLNPPERGVLYLATLKIEKVDSNGESIPMLIESLKSMGIDYHSLLNKLADIGYNIEHPNNYDNFKFRIRENRIYLVDEHFPRIINSSFREGKLLGNILNIRYDIDVSAEPPTPLNDSEVKNLYEKLAQD